MIVATLSKQVYWNNERIEGRFSLGFDTVQSTPSKATIILKLKGKATGYFQGKNIKIHFLNEEKVLFEGELNNSHVGLMPFSFKLPEAAPGSFDFNIPNKAKVSYYVKAFVKGIGELAGKKAKCAFAVNERVRQSSAPILLQNVMASNAYGHVTINVWTDRDIYFPGQVILLRLKLNNQGSVAVNMRLKLMHVVKSTERSNFVHEHQVHSEKLETFPPHFFGIVWVHVPIPQNVPLCSNHPDLLSTYELVADMEYLSSRKLWLPIHIVAEQSLSTIHPVLPVLKPPPTLIRPPLQPDEAVTSCNLCKVEFNFLTRRSHCYHCGLVCCTSCNKCKMVIPKLKYSIPVKVCNTCAPAIAETGGTKYLRPKNVLEEWSTKLSVPWIPKCSKKDFMWETCGKSQQRATLPPEQEEIEL